MTWLTLYPLPTPAARSTTRYNGVGQALKYNVLHVRRGPGRRLWEDDLDDDPYGHPSSDPEDSGEEEVLAAPLGAQPGADDFFATGLRGLLE